MKLRTFIAAMGILVLLAGDPSDSFAQKREKGKKGKEPVKEAVKAPEADKAKPAAPVKKGPVSLEKFITKDTKKMGGFTTVYQKEDKWYINVNDSIIGRDIEVVTRIAKSAEASRNGFSGYAGDIVSEQTVRFEKGPSDKIFLVRVLLRERADGEMSENVKKSSTNAIIASFDIKAQSKDKKDNVIEVNNFLLSDNSIVSFGKRQKRMFNLTNLQKDRSYVKELKTFSINTEFKSVLTYGKDDGSATYEFNSSFVLLPKVPMKARYFDPRVGYFTVRYTDFDADPQGVKRMQLVARWRLEPKPEDMEKYKAGELVEPAKPIVIYIDPTTPKDWIPYLIMGVNDWQPAFEAAGFKNAIRAEVAPTPEQDSTWSLEDATHSAIVYKPSDIANASGPHVSDPRSGEIIETHINWYHNVMSLVRNWYMIQCAPADPMARSMEFPTELMGQLIRFVSSHEVGHTLGLRHNFIGSTCPIYTVDNLKNVEFLKKYGHATSIMDYARFLYLAEEGDNIPRELLYPCIGPYDKWAIEWGYRYYPEFANADEEKAYLSKLVAEKVKDPVYKFGTESDPNDPRLQSEDLGANHMKSNEIGIKNLKYVMANMPDWTKTPNEQYDNMREIYNQTLGQYRRYINHVIKYIGGVYNDQKTSDEEGPIYTHVEKARQKEAWEFLKKHLFTYQAWLFPAEVFEKTDLDVETILTGIYTSSFSNILNTRVLNNLYADELLNGSKAYTIENYFNDINALVFAPTPAKPVEAMNQRVMQKAYVQRLCDVYSGSFVRYNLGTEIRTVNVPGVESLHTDLGAYALLQLETLEAKFKATSNTGSMAARAHNKFLYNRIHKTLTDPKQSGAPAGR